MANNECQIVDALKVAEVFIKELKNKIEKNKLKPKLVGFLANKDPAAVTYADWTGKSCKNIGIEFELRIIKREDLEEAILKANKEESVNGIMVYYPVFGNGHDQYLQNLIRWLDEEKTLKCIIPCTPLAIIKCLEFVGVYNKELECGNQLNGKIISIINRSEVVGRPLAALLANDGARVFSININDILEFHRSNDDRKHYVTDTTLKLEDCLPISDVVISGVPSESFKVNVELCKQGFVSINFSSSKNFNEDRVKTKASAFIPSIGKVDHLHASKKSFALK